MATTAKLRKVKSGYKLSLGKRSLKALFSSVAEAKGYLKAKYGSRFSASGAKRNPHTTSKYPFLEKLIKAGAIRLGSAGSDKANWAKAKALKRKGWAVIHLDPEGRTPAVVTPSKKALYAYDRGLL